MLVFIPIKENSQRVPRKNFRDFGGVPLYKHTLYKLTKHDVYVDTDSEEVKEGIRRDPLLSSVKCIDREETLVGDKVSVCDLISNFVEKYYISQPIIQIHVTSPFLELKTLEDAYSKMGEYDSVVACNVLQTRLWRKEGYGYCPINHNPMKLQQTQELPEIYEENSAFYIFNPEIIKLGNRIGKNPLFYPLTSPENLDIDTEMDFKNCLEALGR